MIRKFRKEDAEECSKIISDCLDKSKDLTKKAKKHLKSTSTPEVLIKKSRDRNYFVYEKNNILCGMGALKNNEVKTMYVPPEFQNKGIGSVILKRIEKEAKKNKIKKLFLYTHPNAVNFYLNNGFKIIKEFKDEEMTIVYMEK